MKKILASILCLGFIATPCFAHGGFDRGFDRCNHGQPPVIEHYDRAYVPNDMPYHRANLRHDRDAAKTAVAVTAGVLGVAALAAILTD